MSQDITWLGASYQDVPAITLPKTGGGTARFTDVTDTTATASDVAQGKYFFAANGTLTAGTASGGSGSSRTVVAPQQTVTTSSSNHRAELDSVVGLVVGGIYVVTFDGTEYVFSSGTLWGGHTIGIGEQAWYVDPTFGGSAVSPFFVFEIFNDISRTITVCTGDTNSHTILIEQVLSGDLTLTSIASQRTITTSSSYTATISNVTSQLVDGGYYLVTYDGTEYALTAEAVPNVSIGDRYVPYYHNDPDDCLYPFLIASSGQTMTLTAVDASASHTIKIDRITDIPDSIPSGGSATYRLDNIVPEQTVACTTLLMNNAYFGFIQNGTSVDNAEQYIVTFDGTEYVCEGYVPEANCSGVGDIRVTQSNAAQYLVEPFFIEYENGSSDYYFVVRGSGTHTVKIDKLTFIDDGETFTTKTITQNGTYNASSDGADGYSSVTVNVSSGGGTYQAKTNISPTTSSQTITPDSGYDALSSVQINAMPTGTTGTPSATKGTVSNHSVSVTPSVTNTTGYITGGTKTGTAVTVSASELVSGNKSITQNGNNIDVADYATVSVNVSGGSSKNVQVAQSTSRATSSTYTSVCSLTCSTAGTYDVYWNCFRSTTGGTSGSQLYIGGSAYGSANTAFTNHAQTNHLTGVSLSKNQTVAVYARSRGSNYYAYCGQLTIVQTA